MDMIEKAKDSARENLQTIKHKVCKLARTLFFALCHHQTMREHQGACIWIKNPEINLHNALMKRLLVV